MEMGDGTQLDLADLAARDPDAAMDIAASMAESITAAAAHSKTPLTFAAAAAAAQGAVDSRPGPMLAGSAAGAPVANVVVPVADVLAVLPQETFKPTARMALRFKAAWAVVHPYWHALMVNAEIPVALARHLTIPLLHEGAYRRRKCCGRCV